MSNTTPNILLIETSAELCSVGLARGSELIAIRESAQRYDHSETVAPYITELLDDCGLSMSQIDAVAVSSGPGSYTGLRVGVSTAKAMSFALGIPLIAVDTLESLFHAARSELMIDGLYFANVDARRMEVYMATFDSSGQRLSPNTAIIVSEDTFDPLIDAGETVVFCGSGTSKCSDLLEGSGITLKELTCSARFMAELAHKAFRDGNFADPDAFKPEYVKAPNITVPAHKPSHGHI